LFFVSVLVAAAAFFRATVHQVSLPFRQSWRR